MEEQLRVILEEEFPGSEVDVDPRPGGKVGGFLIWKDFEQMEQIDRQHKIWEVLKKRLSPEQLLSITAIFALTPVEQEEMTEDQEVA